MEFIITITVLIILAVSLAAALFLSNRSKERLREELSGSKSKIASLEAELGAKVEYVNQLDRSHKEILSASVEQYEKLLSEDAKRRDAEKAEMLSRIQADKIEMDRRRKEELEALEKSHNTALESLRLNFENLTSKNSDTFKEKSEKSIAELLKPVQEKFKEFSETVEASKKDAIERQSKLEQKIIDLENRSQRVGDEARNLANALTGYSKVQGDFGEMLLTQLLEAAGLQEGVAFETQSVMTDENGHEIKSETGRTMIPDVIVKYPGNTVVIIDSKVSMKAYTDFMNSETAEERKKYAKSHIESIKNHINELKSKDYASYLSPGQQKVDYTIMFIPIEGAFRLMLDEDPKLWQAAKDNNVLVVSQMTLLIVLNMISMSWKQYHQEKNIIDVYNTASAFMSQVKNWLDEFVKVGAAIENAKKSYDNSVFKLSDSNQSMLRKGDSMLGQIRKLEALGISPRRSNRKISTSDRNTATESVIPIQLDKNPEEGKAPEA